MAEPFNQPLPAVGQKPWTLNPVVTEMRSRQSVVEDVINTGRLSVDGLETAIGEAAASIEANDATVASLISTPGTETQGELNSVYVSVFDGPHLITKEAVDPTGVNDSSAGIMAAIAKVPASGGALTFPPGRYRHDGIQITGKSNFRIDGEGAVLLATTTTKPYVQLTDCSDFEISGLVSTGANPTVRQGPTRGFSFINVARFRLTDLVARDTEGVGIYFEKAVDGAIVNPVVHNTFADGIHVTHASKRLSFANPVIRDTGDDAFAVVSYAANSDTCEDIEVHAPKIYQSKSRGIAIVGSRAVNVIGGSVRKTKNAGVYIAYEGSYNTRLVRDVLVTGTQIFEANTYDSPTLNQGGVHIAAESGTPGNVTGVVLLGVLIRDSAWRSIFANGTDILADSCRIYGGLAGYHADYGSRHRVVNNLFVDVNGYGVFLASGTSGSVTVRGNTIENANANGTSANGIDGIHLAGSYLGGIIDGNVLIDPSAKLEQAIQANLATNVGVLVNFLNGRPQSAPAVNALLARVAADVRIDGRFGLNGTGPSSKQTIPAAASDLATVQALANAMRTELINRGFVNS